ncbi:MAG TPA: hypothetical protein PKL30_05350 [Leptospiraceae bacterium]|nr:hypothetical protein [Leptospiraceae bacterium]HMY32649.1 hypothetical protein [Leptospiraceae bacterium]HNE10939.1 hypothetical protein [Leptospiraceae bacterium]HNF57899.1 hypothetical protein [Leptospiraceae bacterium]HNH02646.1 hypothetical protein [Leptospiraceae bacterium]
MNNYLYKFEFISSEYENCFYQQVAADNENDAIIEIFLFLEILLFTKRIVLSHEVLA